MAAQTSADLDAILTGGGAPRTALLRYCVMSVTMEPVFVFLAREYRLRPTHGAALALYDVFCARDAVARVSAPGLLPPRDLRLSAAIRPIRQQWEAMQSPRPDTDPAAATTAPYKNLFDFILSALCDDPEGPLAALARRYDPGLEPEMNLPGGKLNVGQRHFVDKVWRALARPRLLRAGFWQVETIE